MSTANRPADRSLDRRGDGPDERARPPGELLDNLRLRLGELAGNHPSAPGYQDARERLAGEDPADPGSGLGGVFDDQIRSADAGSEPPADDQPGGAAGVRPAGAVRTAAAAFAGGLGVLATMELPVRGRPGDPYRPWFMAGEPGSPWWTGTLY